MNTSVRPARDPGLQPERTALAWQRTALSILAGGLVCLRMVPGAIGAWGVALGLAITMIALASYRESRRRFVPTEAALGAGEPVPPGGTITLIVSLGTAALGGAALLFVVMHP